MLVLQELPPEVWARVLQFLSLKDLLNARHVSKDFVPLSTLESFSFTLWPRDTDSVGSLMLFMSRHCYAAGSPKLNLSIRPFPGGTLYPGIMMATSCANLQSLDCSHQQLELSVARTCLQLVPGSLESLSLFAPASLVEDNAWGRLRALYKLDLRWPNVSQPTVYPGTGLMLLTRLSELIFSTDGVHMTDQLEGSKFEMSKLWSLAYQQDPFSGRPDFHKSPTLCLISARNLDPIPCWLKGQTITSLFLSSTAQLVTPDLREWECQRLCIGYRNGDPGMDLSTLLALPSLKHFGVSPRVHQSVQSPMQLRCLAADYHNFMHGRKMTMELDVPVDLFMRQSDHHQNEAESRMRLQANGHTQLCLCPVCKSE